MSTADRRTMLAVDTATRTGSIALLSGGAVAAYAPLDAARTHGSSLAEAVERLPGFDPAAIDAYALTIGPGSFTGLRIGLAFVKGLALVHPRPVVPISTLEVIAKGLLDAHPDARAALVLLDARRGEVYAGLYQRAGAAVAPVPAVTGGDRLSDGLYPLADVRAALGPEDGVVAGGDGLALLGGPAVPDHEEGRVGGAGGADAKAGVRWTLAAPALWSPDARVLGALAWQRRAAGAGTEALQLEPAYLQRSAAEENLKPSGPGNLADKVVAS